MKSSIYGDLYEGLWVASDEFCSKSDIDGMMIYIGPSVAGSRNAFILLYSNNNVVSNTKVNIRFGISNPFLTKTNYQTLYITSEEEFDIMPEIEYCKINLSKNHMIWENDDTVYFSGYKDNINSDC